MLPLAGCYHEKESTKKEPRSDIDVERIEPCRTAGHGAHAFRPRNGCHGTKSPIERSVTKMAQAPDKRKIDGSLQ